MNLDEVLSRYYARLNDVREGLEQARAHAATAAALAVVLAIAAVVLAIKAYWWIGLAPGLAAAFAARGWARDHAEENRLVRLTKFYRRAMERVQGKWAGNGSAGEAFEDPNHPYAHDLNLFGEGSLFELLSIGRSGIGQRGLAKFLLDPVASRETLARQEAVRELSAKIGLREKVALLGPYEFSESSWETFTDWLKSPVTQFPAHLDKLLLVTSVVLACVVLGAVATGGNLLSWALLARIAAPVVVLHAVVGLVLRERVNKMTGSLGVLSSEAQLLREGLELLEGEAWECGRLRQLADRVRGGAGSLRRLERLLKGIRERNQDWFLHVSRLLMVGTQLCIAIEKWRREHGQALLVWMAAWAEFEALNALGGYAYENPENSFPDLAEGEEAVFQARGLGHPLLARESCVRNDVELSRQSRFYIVSGSNMSGKSTLLRAIGQNAVLAAAGAPVRAEALCLSPLAICASISVADSLLNGKSKFLAEVDRLRRAMEAASGETPVLFLIDEIFSGTNSSDRRVAAEAVVRALIGKRAIGALSTHDLALAEIAEDRELSGSNVHMGSRGTGDPMDFDYRLKPGVTREANALAIARMAGVPV